ncbi:MAG: restriction endonuclease subunit S [Prevotella sp.]|jgi:type I restriction enzyme S subunit
MKETNFKDTEFGKIPNGWRIAKFKDVLSTFSSGATPYRGNSNFYKGNIKWISSGELNNKVITDSIEHISQDALERTHLKIYPVGTFLMAITGLEAEGTRGKCCIVGAPSATNQSCLAINGTEYVITNYLYWFYNFWSDYLAFKYCQGTKQQSYTAEIVKNLPIYYPPISEQRRIADALRKVDNLIESIDKLIAKKQAIKKGAMQELLTGKKRLPGFEGVWKTTSIGEIADIVGGGTPSTSNESYWGGSIQWFTPGELSLGKKFLYKSQRTITLQGLANSSAKLLPRNTILLTSRASIGMKAILLNEATTNQGFQSLIVNHSCNTEFVYYMLDTLKNEMIQRASGSTFLEISSTKLSSIEIKVPTLSEQRAIAHVLSTMDSEIEALERKRDKYKQVKQGMMQDLLTGRIRLTEN